MNPIPRKKNQPSLKFRGLCGLPDENQNVEIFNAVPGLNQCKRGYRRTLTVGFLVIAKQIMSIKVTCQAALIAMHEQYAKYQIHYSGWI